MLGIFKKQDKNPPLSASNIAYRCIMKRRAFLNKTLLASATLLLAENRTLFAKNLQDTTQDQNDYLLSPQITYFNHGSIGTMPKIVHDAHKRYLEICETNPWLHIWGDVWKKELKQLRLNAAQFLGCTPNTLTFTHNTTEAFNILANGLTLTEKDEVLFSSINHVGASQAWIHYGKINGYKVRKFAFPIAETPHLSKQDLIDIYVREIKPETKVLVLPHIDNLVGIKHPIAEISTKARKMGVKYIAIDGAQAAGMLPIDMAKYDIDFYATSGHKYIQGPKGTGLFYLKESVQADLKPLWVTFGQESWKGTVRVFEDYGTRNLPEVLTLHDAISFQQKLGLVKTVKKREQLRSHFYNRVEELNNGEWLSPKVKDLNSALFAFKINDRKSNAVFEKMYKQHGFVFRPFNENKWDAIRISLNHFNNVLEIDRFFLNL